MTVTEPDAAVSAAGRIDRRGAAPLRRGAAGVCALRPPLADCRRSGGASRRRSSHGPRRAGDRARTIRSSPTSAR